ncbi:unnamed protein product [Lampetra planeri]
MGLGRDDEVSDEVWWREGSDGEMRRSCGFPAEPHSSAQPPGGAGLGGSGPAARASARSGPAGSGRAMFGRKRRRPEISAPRNFVHRVHTGYDPQGMRFTGLPVQWHGLLQETLAPRHRHSSPDPSCIPPRELRAMKKIVRGRQAATDGDFNGLLDDFYKLSIPGSNSLYSECATRQSCVSDQGPLSNWERTDRDTHAHKQQSGPRPQRHSSEPSPHREYGVYPDASAACPAGLGHRPDSPSHGRSRGSRDVRACVRQQYEAFPLLSSNQPLSVACAPAENRWNANVGGWIPKPRDGKSSSAFCQSGSDSAEASSRHRHGANAATPPHGGNGPGPAADRRRSNNNNHHDHSAVAITAAALTVAAHDEDRRRVVVAPAQHRRAPQAASFEPPNLSGPESCDCSRDAVRYRHRDPGEHRGAQQQQQQRQRPHSLLEPAVGPVRLHERPWSGYALWGPQLPLAPGLSRVRRRESQEFV